MFTGFIELRLIFSVNPEINSFEVLEIGMTPNESYNNLLGSRRNSRKALDLYPYLVDNSKLWIFSVESWSLIFEVS